MDELKQQLYLEIDKLPSAGAEIARLRELLKAGKTKEEQLTKQLAVLRELKQVEEAAQLQLQMKVAAQAEKQEAMKKELEELRAKIAQKRQATAKRPGSASNGQLRTAHWRW